MKKALLSEVVLAETIILSTELRGRATDEGEKDLRMVRPQTLKHLFDHHHFMNLNSLVGLHAHKVDT